MARGELDLTREFRWVNGENEMVMCLLCAVLSLVVPVVESQSGQIVHLD